MDRNEELLARFEREYMAINSLTTERRVMQLKLLRRLAATLDHPLDEMTPGDVLAFVGTDLAAGYHPNTARKHMGMIRSFVTWARQAGVIDSGRAAEIRTLDNPRGSTGRSRPNPYKVSEIAELRRRLSEKYPVLRERGPGSHFMRNFLAGRSPRLHRHLWRHAVRLQYEAQIALALECGLRRIEIFGLSIPAMHYDNDEVVVLTAKQGPGIEVTRAIPYPTHARNCVQEWLDFRLLLRPPHPSPWLLLSMTGPIEQQIAPLTWRSFRAGLEPFGKGWEWRRLRHTAATEWLRSGVPLEKVSRFMGHSNLEQTLAYAQILSSDISEAFGKAEADFARRLGLAA